MRDEDPFGCLIRFLALLLALCMNAGQSFLIRKMVQDEITAITSIDWCVRFRVKTQSHNCIAPWTINLVRDSFSRVLYFNSSHDDNLGADGYNRASTLRGGSSLYRRDSAIVGLSISPAIVFLLRHNKMLNIYCRNISTPTPLSRRL